MTRMNEVVGICLHRALRSSVFFGGDVFSNCGRGGARRRREAVLQLAVGEPSARARARPSGAVRSSASERRMNDVCGRRVSHQCRRRRRAPLINEPSSGAR